MIKIKVCIGSACHVKGSRRVVEGLQYQIAERKLKDKINLGGVFCMGRCQEGVCVASSAWAAARKASASPSTTNSTQSPRTR